MKLRGNLSTLPLLVALSFLVSHAVTAALHIFDP